MGTTNALFLSPCLHVAVLRPTRLQITAQYNLDLSEDQARIVMDAQVWCMGQGKCAEVGDGGGGGGESVSPKHATNPVVKQVAAACERAADIRRREAAAAEEAAAKSKKPPPKALPAKSTCWAICHLDSVQGARPPRSAVRARALVPPALAPPPPRLRYRLSPSHACSAC
jgi:hypothetical protein